MGFDRRNCRTKIFSDSLENRSGIKLTGNKGQAMIKMLENKDKVLYYRCCYSIIPSRVKHNLSNLSAFESFEWESRYFAFQHINKRDIR